MVFLLFHIGLELSLEKLQSMRKFVFGLGSSQVRPQGAESILLSELERRTSFLQRLRLH